MSDQNNQTEPLQTTDEHQIETLNAQLAEAQDQALRLRADLENIRRREQQQKQSWSQDAVAMFLQKLIPSFLELKLGQEHAQDETLKTVIEKFFSQLQSHGLTAISPEPGTLVDPLQHEVVMVAEGAPNTIAQVFENGWQYQDRVITPAKVSAAPQN